MKRRLAAWVAIAAAVALWAAAGGLLLARIPGAAQPEPAATEETPLGKFIPATPPHPAPSVVLTTPSDTTVALSAFAGKPVLLNFWATWCAPCRREMPSLERLQARFGQDLAVLAVSEDVAGAKVVAPFLAKLGLRAVTVYLDPKNVVGHAFEVQGLPTSFVINRTGEVLGRVEGEADWLSPAMLEIIAPLVKPLKPHTTLKTSLSSEPQ